MLHLRFRTFSFLLALSLTLLASCNQRKSLFTALPSDKTGIDFQNTIIETDSVNVLDFENVYNGGGVGIADFNNDSLPDIYFSGNLVPNKLYLNQGNLKFRDVTDQAHVAGEGRWSRGVAVVDINNDGLQDIYVCTTLKRDPEQRRNILYINQGVDKTGTPSFKDMAREYGLDDTAQSTMAAFFDYDNDGDLDMYLVNNEIIKGDYPNRFRPAMKDGSHPNTDKLYRNDWNDSLKHPVYTNVSKAAGIQIDGYGHSVNICDINRDGWKDVYVTNDYLSNDLLWINNHDGTFTESLNTYFKHTSANAMGNDIIDINNDGLVDVVALDMNPEDNFRKKMMMNPNSYQTYQNSDYFGYGYQYVRNTLQLNQGPRVLGDDSLGAPIFSEVAFFAGMAETDWSWTPLVADLDLDGKRDILITNGFPKDVTDHDFVAFRDESFAIASRKQLLEQIPEVKIHNYAYRNTGGVKFENKTSDWGFNVRSFSNGAVYADLDNDGDLDIVVNNINDKAFVYQNTLRDATPDQAHYLTVGFEGPSNNLNGFGAWVELYYGKQKQVYENTPYRGYLSSILPVAVFGLGTAVKADSLLVYWPDGKRQKLEHITADSHIRLAEANANPGTLDAWPVKDTTALFTDITSRSGIRYIQEEKDFIDFNIQKLLPHKLSEYGPGMAVGDVDGNGLEDIVTSGSFTYSGQLFLQQSNGSFQQRNLFPNGGTDTKRWEELGLLLIDLDKDGDLDIYTASGGYENQSGTGHYQDHIYLNNGKGSFTPDTTHIPVNLTSKSCVRAADYDNDGDLDLFIAGRVDPWNYPKPVSSFIYRNDSKPGAILFTDVTTTVAKELAGAGLVCDALFTDYDNDGWTDLLLAGEWMPLTFFRNENGVFRNVTAGSGLEKRTGWWNSLAAADFDKDGDIDYIAGNMGTNSFYRSSEQYPAFITAKDFDNNNSFDAFPSLFLPGADGVMREYPAQTRDDIVKQMISMRTKFQNYKTYANATMDEVLTAEQRKGAIRLMCNTPQSMYCRNDGGGKFTLVPLPAEAQYSQLNGMIADDFNGDGNPDLLINGNDYGTEVSVGRYDALNGLLLLGDGKGRFRSLSIRESGIFIPGNGKSLVKFAGANGSYRVAAAQNRGPLKCYTLRNRVQWVSLQPEDRAVKIYYTDGSTEWRERYFGQGFLSQSGNGLMLGGSITKIDVISAGNKKRTINPQ